MLLPLNFRIMDHPTIMPRKIPSGIPRGCPKPDFGGRNDVVPKKKKVFFFLLIFS